MDLKKFYKSLHFIFIFSKQNNLYLRMKTMKNQNQKKMILKMMNKEKVLPLNNQRNKIVMNLWMMIKEEALNSNCKTNQRKRKLRKNNKKLQNRWFLKNKPKNRLKKKKEKLSQILLVYCVGIRMQLNLMERVMNMNVWHVVGNISKVN